MIENLETFVNRKGFPIIRRCFNCKNWAPYTDSENKTLGYCKLRPLYFAFTLQPTVFTITKDFYLCEQHQFKNEDILGQVSEKILLKNAIKKKEDIVQTQRNYDEDEKL
jgi:hypothetical protein